MVPVDAGAETEVEVVVDADVIDEAEAITSTDEGATDAEETMAEIDGVAVADELDTTEAPEAETLKS